MLVPVKWLKDFVNIDNISIPELADKLVSCGFEIEAVINQADALNLGNKNYEIVRFYPMPGRNYKITITYHI